MSDEVHTFRTPSTGFWARVYYTPASDAWRGQLTARLDVRRIILSHDLPVTLANRVYEVVRRTRLFRRERVDVARELAGHFADGLAAGVTVDRLLEQFGDPRQAAKLIRRAKLRQRPLILKAVRALPRWIGVAAVVAMLVWTGLEIRFRSGAATISHDYWQDAAADRLVPAGEADAWPLYRAAAARWRAAIVTPKQKEVIPNQGSALDWVESVRLMKPLVKADPELIPLIRQASASEHSGIRLHPYQGEDRWGAPGSKDCLTYAMLDGLYEMRDLSNVIIVDGLIALDEQDADRFIADLKCLLRMAEQCRGPATATLVEPLIATHMTHKAWRLLGRCLRDNPELLSDEQLRELSRTIAGHWGGGRLRADYTFEHWTTLDVLQRSFTDDGRGGGRITADGFDRWVAANELYAMVTTVSSGTDGASGEAATGSSVGLPRLLRCIAALTVADRAAQRQICDRYYELLADDLAPPPWQWRPFRSTAYLEQMTRDGLAQYRNALVANMLEGGSPSAQAAMENATQERDAMLVVIALELYRREHGGWPARLADLVPGCLPEVPPDRRDGQPLRYVLRDGNPVVYGIGYDCRDDGGHPPPLRGNAWPYDYELREAILAGTKKVEPGRHGDWIHWPPQVQ